MSPELREHSFVTWKHHLLSLLSCIRRKSLCKIRKMHLSQRIVVPHVDPHRLYLCREMALFAPYLSL